MYLAKARRALVYEFCSIDRYFERGAGLQA